MAYNTKELVTDLNTKPVPQYYNESADSYEVLKGANGAALMQLTGRNVEKTTVLNAVAVVATAGLSVAIDTKKYKDFDFLVTNTHDQPVRIAFLTDSVGFYDVVKTDGTIAQYYTFSGHLWHEIPAGSRGVLLSSAKLTGANNPAPFKQMYPGRLHYRCNVAPTSGSLTIEMVGVLN